MTAFAPHTLAEALELRAAHPEAIPVAGGTDLMVEVNARRLRPVALLDLSSVDELRSWRGDGGSVSLGAGITFARVGRELAGFLPLAQAALSVASPQIRNRATIGGNIGTASPAGDALPVLAAYEATVVVAAAKGRMRRIPLRDFLTGPKRTSLEADELIVGVEWQPVTGPGTFLKVGNRGAMTVAIVSACLQVDEARHAVRLALGSVGPTVLRAERAERFASDVEWSGSSTCEEFGRLAAMDARPIDDRRGTAAFRRHAIRVLASRLLARAGEGTC